MTTINCMIISTPMTFIDFKIPLILAVVRCIIVNLILMFSLICEVILLQ